MGRDLAPAEGEDHLDEGGGAGGRLEVAKVRLDRADEERAVGRARAPEDGAGAPELDRVAERRAGSVRLEVVDRRRLHAGRRERPADHALLGRTVRRGEPVRGAVLVDGRAPDHGQDPVAAPAGVGEALEDDEAAALAARVAVGPPVEGLAPPVRGERAELREVDHPLRREEDVDAAGQGEVAFARGEAPAREVDGDEARRAGRVEGHVRTLEAQRVRDPPGRHAEGAAGPAVGVDLPGATGAEVAEVGARDPDVDARLAPGQRGGRDPGVLEGLPGDLEQEALLRIHAPRLARGDPEELRVEEVDAVEEAAVADVGLARPVRVGIEPPLDVPAIGRDLSDRVDAAGEQFPELLGRLHPAREPAADPDDRDRLLGDPRPLDRDEAFRRGRGQPFEQVIGQPRGARVVVEEGRREGEAERGRQRVPQIEGHERVESELGERSRRVERPSRFDSQDAAGLGHDVVEEDPPALAGGGRADVSAPEGLAGRRARHGPGGAGGDDRDLQGPGGQDGLERPESRLAIEGIGPRRPRRSHPRPCPGTPVDRRRRQAQAAAVPGEGVESGVRRRVCRLAPRPDDAGD